MTQANSVDWFILVGKVVSWLVLVGIFCLGVYHGGTQ